MKVANAYRSELIILILFLNLIRVIYRYVTKKAASQANQNLVAEMTKLLMKADETAVQPPIPIMDVSTKVSIPLSPKSLKLLKPEPETKRAVVQFMLPRQTEKNDHMEAETDDSQLVPIFVPSEESSFIDNIEDVSVSMRFLNCLPKMKKEYKGFTQGIADNRISQKGGSY